jgi:hypothetical protein
MDPVIDPPGNTTKLPLNVILPFTSTVKELDAPSTTRPFLRRVFPFTSKVCDGGMKIPDASYRVPIETEPPKGSKYR